MLGAGCWVLDAGSWALDAGVGHWRPSINSGQAYRESKIVLISKHESTTIVVPL